MAAWLDHEFAGHLCRMYPDGAMYVEALATTFISDVHIGKSGQFRKDGIPTPVAAHHHGMKRLQTALERHPKSTVVFLGDLFEGRQNTQTAALERLFSKYPKRSFILVKGNHDFDIPDWNQLQVLEEYEIGNFICLHEPPGCDFDRDIPFDQIQAQNQHPKIKTGKVLLCGHLHPGAALRGKGRFKVKIKTFFFNHWIGVLPAFGALTGHHSLGQSGAYFGIAENSLIDLGNWEE